MTVQVHKKTANDPILTGEVRIVPKLRKSARRVAATILRNSHFPGRFKVYTLLRRLLGENVGRVIVPLSAGGKLLVDGAVDSEFFFLGQYEWNIEGFLLNSVRPGSVVFDVGANIGAYTIPLALRVGEHGHVYAFEAFRPNYEMLTESISLNNLTNVTAVFGAVADRSGTLEVPNPERSQSKFFGNYSLASDSPNRTLIPAWSLDDFAAQNGIDQIELMKIDIEGSETMAFKGARSLLAGHKVKTIVFELNPHWLRKMGSSAEQLWGIAESLGATPFVVTRWSRLKPIGRNYILQWLSEPDASGKLDVVLKFRSLT